MKVYIVIYFDYDDFDICEVFETERAASSYISRQNSEDRQYYYINEREIKK